MSFRNRREVRADSGIRASRAEAKIAILAYHKIDDCFEWGLTRTTIRQFREQMTMLRGMGYRICSLKDYYADPGNDKIAVTFDDAFESVYENAYPVLQEFGCSFTIFPLTGYIGRNNKWEVNVGGRKFRHMSWEQILNMEGVEIGSHGVSHRDLTGLAKKELTEELCRSKQTLEERTGVEVEHLSLPFGRYDQRVAAAAAEAGYRRLFSLCPGIDEGNVYGRYGVYLTDTLFDIRNKTGGGLLNKFEKFKLQSIHFFSRGTILAQRLGMAN